MTRRRNLIALFALAILAAGPGLAGRLESAEGTGTPAPSEGPEANREILVEIFLAPEHHEDAAEIKRQFASASVTRVKIQFFRLGNPAENLAIGKEVPAEVARMAIDLSIRYNRGVKYLLPEYRFFPQHIAIGTSAYDEKSQIPITPEDLKKLADPSLSTTQFHELYRHLTGEDKRLPTYLH